MQSPFAITGSAWGFFRTQPLLNQVTGWLFIAPLTLSFLCDIIVTKYNATFTGILSITTRQLSIVAFIIQLLLSIWVFWGYGATLAIGERIVKSKAGRSRSSIQAVYKEGKTIVLPLFLTSIIRDCITFLFALPYFLVILFYLLTRDTEYINGFIGLFRSLHANPTVAVDFTPYSSVFVIAFFTLPLLALVLWYRVRTALFHVIIGLENVEYRKALSASKKLVQGRFWAIFAQFIFITILTFTPAMFIADSINMFVNNFDERLIIVTALINGTITGIAMVVYILATIFLYKDLLSNS